jgi:hypothetical protein
MPLFGRRLTAAFDCGAFCTFWPQKVVTPRSSPAGHSYLLPSKGSDTPRGKTAILPFAVGIRKRSRSAKINGPTVARNVFFATFVLTIRLRADCLLCFT